MRSVLADSTLFVRDTPDADVTSPKAFGMSAVHFDRHQRDTGTSQLTDLWQLLRRLGIENRHAAPDDVDRR